MGSLPNALYSSDAIAPARGGGAGRNAGRNRNGGSRECAASYGHGQWAIRFQYRMTQAPRARSTASQRAPPAAAAAPPRPTRERTARPPPQPEAAGARAPSHRKIEDPPVAADARGGARARRGASAP
eukprot:gene13441-biopygen12969